MSAATTILRRVVRANIASKSRKLQRAGRHHARGVAECAVQSNAEMQQTIGKIINTGDSPDSERASSGTKSSE